MSTARLRDTLGPSGDTEESHLLRLIADAVVVIWNVFRVATGAEWSYQPANTACIPP